MGFQLEIYYICYTYLKRGCFRTGSLSQTTNYVWPGILLHHPPLLCKEKVWHFESFILKIASGGTKCPVSTLILTYTVLEGDRGVGLWWEACEKLSRKGAASTHPENKYVNCCFYKLNKPNLILWLVLIIWRIYYQTQLNKIFSNCKIWVFGWSLYIKSDMQFFFLFCSIQIGKVNLIKNFIHTF